MALVLLSATSAAQDLPRGGGSVPDLRRGADGQIEIVPPNPVPGTNASRAKSHPQNAAPEAAVPKPGAPQAGRGVAAPAARPTAPQPAQPVITVSPTTPRVPAGTRPGAVVATFSVTMSDGSPFTGTVRFGAPHYDGKKVFVLSGDKIIVNPDGPGLGPARAGTHHITLEAVP